MDLRFDMSPGHFTAIDLATGRNLYTGGEEQETIAAGQVVRVNGRILFSEDETPAPEGAFDIVIGNLELEWRAVPRDGGVFTSDILVPNVRSGHLDMLAWLENLPGLAGDKTEDQPRILLEVDGNSPIINAILPSGDITIDEASSIDVFINSSDDHGFDSQRKAVLHYKVKAGESEVSRGSQEFGTLLEQYGYGHWTGVVDLTDGGVTELLPGYVVDVWVTGADAAGNPYVSENNTENNPLSQWQIIRIGPTVDLMELDVLWSDATPVSGDNVSLEISGTNLNGEEGTLTFALQQKTKDGDWINVANASADTLIRPNGDFFTEITISTVEVDEETVERYRLVVKDGHVILDRMSLDPLILQPPVARDGQAISEQFSEQTGTVLLYVALMVALIAIVVLIVMNRKLSIDDDESDPADQTVEVTSELQAAPPPPPGFISNTPPPPPGLNSESVVSNDSNQEVETQVANEDETTNSVTWTDEMLIDQGWTEAQVLAYRAQQSAESQAPVISGTELNYNDAVVKRVMEKYGLTDKEKFLAYAEFFDADGNKYLKEQELENAAAEIMGTR